MLPKALAAAESRADTAAHHLAIQHADDVARPPAPITADQHPVAPDNHLPASADTPELPDLPRHVEATSGGTGAWNYELNHPTPNTNYTVNDQFHYSTDDLSRVHHADRPLNLDNPADRNGYQQRIAGGDDRLPGDHGGHIIGLQFGGPGEALNLTAMRDSLDGVGARDYYNLESEWKSFLQQGKNVEVSVDVSYSGSSMRPDRYTVYTYVDGETASVRRFRN